MTIPVSPTKNRGDRVLVKPPTCSSANYPNLGEALNERELAVLRGISQGKSNGQIGREMYLAEDTVKTYNRRIFRKLGARDRANAVHLGHLAGLLGGGS